MENPLISSDSSEENKPAQMPVMPETPKAVNPAPQASAAKTEAPKAKKTFFTIGKIIAIFGALIVIAAVVGAIIYSQTSEQFQGMSLTKLEPVATETQPLEGVSTVSSGIATLIKTPSCNAEQGLILNEAGDGCICPEDNLFNYETNICEVVDYCDLTDEETKKAVGDMYTAPNTLAELREIMSDYTNWHDANCDDLLIGIAISREPLTSDSPDYTKEAIPSTTTELTCNDYINEFKAAYVNKNWAEFKTALTTMVKNNCISHCKEKLYLEIYYLWTNDIAQAKQVAAENKNECAGCNNQFNFLALVSQVMSDIDLAQQEAGGQLSSDYTEFLTDLAADYVGGCQCVELESLLDNPSFDIQALFPESTTDETTLTPSATSADNPFVYLNDNVLTIAYAQSATLSPTVISVLEGAVELCEPAAQPANCSSLEIVSPTNDALEIIDDFDPVSDKLEFNVTGTDNVANYRIEASNDSLTFDGEDSNIYTDNTNATLAGGPTVDNPVTITVTAIDVTGLPLTDECSDTVTITRAVPETTEPVCRSLNIVSPSDANQSGTAEFVIPAGGFVDEPLTVEIDGDQDSWGNIIYQTSTGNTDIDFDGANPLITDALTISMNGRPETNDSETIEVFALDPETNQPIDGCSDSFTVTVDNDTPPSLTYTPPEDAGEPPSLTYTPPDEEEPPSLAYTPEEESTPSGGSSSITPTEEEPPTTTHAAAPEEEPVQPVEPEEPTYVATSEVLHEAPSTPSTGPGLIIPLIGVSLAGAWTRRKKR